MKNSHTSELFCHEILNKDFGPDFLRLITLHNERERGTLGQMTESTDYDLVKMSSKDTRVIGCLNHLMLFNCHL